jgi:glucose-1-phosphate thymidylyltransferase
MKAIIPVAGFGSRLRPHTFTVPKAMLPVAGKPIIGHIIEQVIGWGATRATMIVGHLRESFEEYLPSHFDIPFEFRPQEKILGLGHAVLTGLDTDDEQLIIILGDTILETDMTPVIKKGITSIGVKPVEDARKFGVVEMDSGRVTRLIEKPPVPPTNLAIVGVYYIRNGGMLAKAIEEIIEQGITVKGEYQLTDALQLLLNWGERIETFPVEGWFDCGKPDTLLATNRYLLDRDGGKVHDGPFPDSVIIPPVFIDKQVIIEKSVVGPYVTIGSKTKIHNCIVTNTICGEDSILTNGVVTASLIGNRCRVNGRSDSINIGASSEIEI